MRTGDRILWRAKGTRLIRTKWLDGNRGQETEGGSVEEGVFVIGRGRRYGQPKIYHMYPNANGW